MNNQIDALIQQTTAEHPDTRRKSAIELGASGQTASRQDATQALIQLLADEVIAVREAAEEALIQTGGTTVIDALIPCLQDPSTTVVNYTVEILSQIGKADIGKILALLESKDHDVRKFGCDILGNLTYRESVYELIALLNDPHINVAIAAGEALGKLGRPEAVPHLMKALQHTDTWMKCIAAEALGNIGDTRAVDPFIAMSDYEDPIVLYTVIKAMGNLPDDRVLPYILSVLRSNHLFASSAAQAIERLADIQGDAVYHEVKISGIEAPFIRLLKSENPDVLRSAIRLVGKLQIKEAIHLLGKLLEHQDKRIVARATEALVHIGKPGLDEIHTVFEQTFSYLQSEVAESVEEPSAPFAKVPIIRVLGQIGSHRSIHLLVEALDETVADDIRIEAALALGKILGQFSRSEQSEEYADERVSRILSAVKKLIAVAEDSGEALRVSAIEALGESGFQEAFEPLIMLLYNPSPEVREAASLALTKIQGMTPEQKLRPVRKMLYAPESHLPGDMKASLVRTVYRIAGEQDAEQLVALFQDPSHEVRAAAIEAVTTFSPTGPLADHIHQRLVPLLHDPDEHVRIAAIQALAEWGRRLADRQSGDVHRTFLEKLMEMVSDPHPRIRYETCQALAHYVPCIPPSEHTRDQLVENMLHLLDDPDMMVKISAVEAVAALGESLPHTAHVVSVLQSLTEHTENTDLIRALDNALSRLNT